jgi:DNA-binding transcriptional LysR family regulator
MDQMEQLRCLLAVADAGSLAGAARRLGVSAPAVTRGLAALEARLGVLLFQRSTRSLRPTEAGERFIPDCRRILAELDEAQAAVTGLQGEVRGSLAITAPQLFGRLHVAPLVLDFMRERPLLQVRCLLADRLVPLLDAGIDVALRIAPLPDSGLTALPLGALRRLVVAAPGYLARHGRPRTPQELAGHRGIGFSSVDALAAAPWKFRDGSAVLPQIGWLTNDNELALAAAEAGQGFARCLAYQAAAGLAAGRLAVVLEDYEPAPVPVQLVYPAGRRAPAKVRDFLDFAAARLRALPVLGGADWRP